MSVWREPAADGAPGQRDGRGREGSGIRGVDRTRQLVEQPALVAHQLGLTRHHGGDVAPGDVVEQREELVTHAVAAECAIGVGRVLDWYQTELVAQRPRLAPTEAEERVPFGVHGRETVESRAPHEVEQDGLGLVVGGVPSERVGRENRVARLARPRFEVRARAHRRAGRDERGTEAGRGRSYDAGLAVGPRPQAVVDVHRGHLATRLTREHEEGEGVGAARDGAGHAGARCREPAPTEQAARRRAHRRGRGRSARAPSGCRACARYGAGWRRRSTG